MEHMGKHYSHSPKQYAVWAKYALKLELSQEECCELFMDGLHSDELVFDEVKEYLADA